MPLSCNTLSTCACTARLLDATLPIGMLGYWSVTIQGQVGHLESVWDKLNRTSPLLLSCSLPSCIGCCTSSLSVMECNSKQTRAEAGCRQHTAVDCSQCWCCVQGHSERLGRVAFHPMGRHVGTASFDETWRFWDVESSACLVEQEGHSRAVYTVAFHPDGSLAASGGLDAVGEKTGPFITLIG